jgi:RecJ-like exonuclease
MPPKNRRSYCSARCQRLQSTYRGARPTSTECRQCGGTVDFMGATVGGQFRRTDTRLCAPCRERRAVGRGASVEELALRDGEVCGICDEAVDMALAFPHVLSPTVDHIKPWANGGTHDERNLQLAHLRCNCVKHNRELPLPTR